ncbi:probable peroxisomal membrane protein PEX13 [Copidosoma floridanum]|uniref:probable peroxisomal membrane protein PEX13 n=1 Tax=Copidosoma floridanum TaxID=29053 RepID=UPI0006C9A518|nr:probable peroxisomal membrane protein PEX13 [Copidosoma floridanum]
MMNQQSTSTLGSTPFRQPSPIVNGLSQPAAMPGFTQTTGVPGVPTIAPPPLPPRRPVSSYQSPYGPFGSSHMNSYGGYGSGWNGYNRFGSMGMGYGSYGYNPSYSMYGQNQWGGPSGDVENRFVQYAEESTRPAFQSIEAMVQTFSSLTMMLESTFFAMTSSFRALLGVADNMGKLRSMLRQLLGSFALIRFLKWLYHKVKHTLGLRNQNTNSEMLWRETISEVMNGGAEQTTGTSSWPIYLFLSILFATPYLIHRLVNNAKNASIDVNNPKEWLQNKELVYTATALYDFVPASSEELPLKTGQKVWLAPQSLQPKNLPGWWRATDSIKVGLIPGSYVTVVGHLKKKADTNQVSQMSTSIYQSPVINENFTAKENSESQEFTNSNKDSNKDFVESNNGNIFQDEKEN